MTIDRTTGILVSLCMMFCIVLSIPSGVNAQFSTNSSLNISQEPVQSSPVLTKQEERELLGFTGDTSSRKLSDFPNELPQAQQTPPTQVSTDSSSHEPPLGTEALREAASKENSAIGGTKTNKTDGNPIATGSEYTGSDRTQYINTAPEAGTKPTYSVVKTMLSLLVVLILIGGAAWLVRKLFPQQANLSMGDIVQVVGRSQIDSRHNLSLVKFGDELLLLGVTAENVSLLDKVKDPDQIARLMGKIEAARVSSISRSFAGVFGKAREDYEMGTDLEDEVIVEEYEDNSSEVDRELDGLLNKVKGLGRINRGRQE